MTSPNADQQKFIEDVIVRRRSGEQVPQELIAQAAGYLGQTPREFMSMYRGSAPQRGMDVRLMLPEQRQAIMGSNLGMFFSPGDTLQGFLGEQRIAQSADADASLSRGDVRRILRYADGASVSYELLGNDQVQFTFADVGGGAVRSDPLRISPRAQALLAQRLGAAHSETPLPLPQTAQASRVIASVDAGEHTFVPPVRVTMDQNTIDHLGSVVSAALEKPEARTVAAIEQFLQASGASVSVDGRLSGSEAAAALNRIYGMAGQEISQPTDALIQALPPAPKPDRTR